MRHIKVHDSDEDSDDDEDDEDAEQEEILFWMDSASWTAPKNNRARSSRFI